MRASTSSMFKQTELNQQDKILYMYTTLLEPISMVFVAKRD